MEQSSSQIHTVRQQCLQVSNRSRQQNTLLSKTLPRVLERGPLRHYKQIRSQIHQIERRNRNKRIHQASRQALPPRNTVCARRTRLYSNTLMVGQESKVHPLPFLLQPKQKQIQKLHLHPSLPSKPSPNALLGPSSLPALAFLYPPKAPPPNRHSSDHSLLTETASPPSTEHGSSALKLSGLSILPTST